MSKGLPLTSKVDRRVVIYTYIYILLCRALTVRRVFTLAPSWNYFIGGELVGIHANGPSCRFTANEWMYHSITQIYIYIYIVLCTARRGLASLLNSINTRQYCVVKMVI